MTSPYLKRRTRKLDEVLERKSGTNSDAPPQETAFASARWLPSRHLCILPGLLLLAVCAWLLSEQAFNGDVEVTAEELKRILEIAPAAGGGQGVD